MKKRNVVAMMVLWSLASHAQQRAPDACAPPCIEVIGQREYPWTQDQFNYGNAGAPAPSATDNGGGSTGSVDLAALSIKQFELRDLCNTASLPSDLLNFANLATAVSTDAAASSTVPALIRSLGALSGASARTIYQVTFADMGVSHYIYNGPFAPASFTMEGGRYLGNGIARYAC